MKWIKKDLDSDLVRELSTRFGTDLLTSAILVRRGIIEYEEILYFLENDVRYLHNPFQFAEMEDAIDRIHRAADEGEKVLIFGDRDVDGIVAIVLLFQELTGWGIDAEWSLPIGDEPYGISRAAVEDFNNRNGTLIITVDCGISNHEEIIYAKERGIDTIVLDHHNPHETIPAAYAVINPKLEDSGYPFEGLAGCAVVAKFIWALRFSKTDLYNRTVCLLNIRPANEMYVVEAVKLFNLTEVDRLVENIVPQMVSIDQTRLFSFVADQEIYVFDDKIQTLAFRRAFGDGVEINVFDTAPEIRKTIPSLKGKSLFRIHELSRMVKYRNTLPSEIDVFVNLFTSYLYSKEKSLSDEFIEILDLVALGTLADLMPLHNENRILVRLGMEELKRGRRKGLYELLFKQGLLGKKFGTKDISWYIAPIINATGRMGMPDKTVRLLLAESNTERDELAEEIIGMNKERKNLGDKTWDSIFSQANTSYNALDRKLVVVSGDNIQRGITGIIAAKLVNHFRTTALVISIQSDKAIGSARSSGNVNVKDLLSECSELFLDYGGHDYAAGFSLPIENLDTFKTKIEHLSADIVMTEKGEDTLEIDAELPLPYMNPNLIETVEKFEPYGEENPPLIFLVKDVEICDMYLVGKSEKQHVKLTIDAGQNKWPAVFWNASARVDRDFSLGDKVDIVFRMGRNYFQNREHLQLTILDIKK